MCKHQKKITAEGSMGSNSKYRIMKSLQNIQNGSGAKVNKTTYGGKKKNASGYNK
ncbi:hypothetical protein [Pontimicrobium aquaticum]|uniref:hypothetical protein n=1 Tax=Pontimicrobium aquaticum TaxID=2565367 RepID=UPI00145EABD6|nr:hypothetical protein [Pontimicrobium aquaticum]